MPEETKIKGTTFDTVANRILNITAKQVAGVARKTIISNTIGRGWKRFKTTIKQETIDKDTEKVYITDTNNAAKIALFLHGGTKAHFISPVNKKALHWKGNIVSSKYLSAGMAKSTRTSFFSKGHNVSGIKATNFFGNTAEVITATNNFVSNKFKEAVR